MSNFSDKPLVSIIIPTLNVAGTIKKCLQSCADQTYPNIEIIVNDGNKNGPSTDDTVRIIKEFADIKLIFDNRGVAQARNAGNKLAEGFYVFHIDSDMELSPDLVEKAVLTAEKGDYDVLIVPEVSIGDTFWAKCRSLERKMFSGDQYQERANRFMKKSVFEAVGGMDENLWGGEDSDLSLRIKKAGYKIGRIDSVIFHYEPTFFIITLGKYYRYGKTFPSWLKKNKKSDFVKQFFPSYLFTKRNLKLLASDPIHAVGFLFLKSIIYIVSIYGLVIGYFKKISLYSFIKKIKEQLFKVKLTLNTISNSHIFLLDYFRFLKGDIIYKIRNSPMKFITRAGTPDKNEIVVVVSGYEYRLDLLPKFNHPVIFDLGGHIGSCSIYAKNFYKKSNPEIYAFEPDKENFEYFKKNTEINNLFDIKIFNLAIGDYNGIGYLNKKDKKTDAYFISKEKSEDTAVCEIKTLDTITDELKINKIDILKIDIEGGEYDLLAHDRSFKFLMENVSYIMMECHYLDGNKNLNWIKNRLSNYFNIFFERENLIYFRNKFCDNFIFFDNIK